MKNKKMLLFILLLLPEIVLAQTSNEFPLSVAIGMEMFVSIHMSVFVLWPLAKLKDPVNSKNLFLKYFLIRAGILLFCDIFISPTIALLDFFMVFIGACIVLLKQPTATKKPIYSNNTLSNTSNLVLKCTKCGHEIAIEHKFCENCGAPIEGDNIAVSVGATPPQDTSPVVTFNINYNLSENKLLENIIKEELVKRGEDIKKLSTTSINVKRNILLGFLFVGTFIVTLLYFFNFDTSLCLLCETIIFIITIFIFCKTNILQILCKKIKQNPNKEISNIVGEAISQKSYTMLPSFLKFVLVLFFAIFIPTINFIKPKIIYIPYSDGYEVFKYSRSIYSEDKVTIPDTYKNKKVLSIGVGAFKNSKIKEVTLPSTIEIIKTEAFLNSTNIAYLDIPSSVIEIRARAFENMSSLKTINLKEGITTIRASVFKNDTSLSEITLPSTLEYLGASAFENCSSIKSITIPLKVTEINGETFKNCTSLETVNLHDNINSIHGETFMNCTSLTNITLPKNITEIKGSTFENCTSLKKIDIPEGVTRIGGSAFRDCSRLAIVTIPKSVNEIGSSAFRNCYQLDEVTISKSAYVNERAFKNSSTTIKYYR